jgi:hypothetical protein
METSPQEITRNFCIPYLVGALSPTGTSRRGVCGDLIYATVCARDGVILFTNCLYFSVSYECLKERKKKKVLGLRTKYVLIGQEYIHIVRGGSVLDDTNLMGKNMNMMTEAESILGASKEVRLGRIAQN